MLEPLSFYSQFSVVDIDWSNAKALWVVPPMRDEELLVEQCALLKALNPSLRCFVCKYSAAPGAPCVLLLLLLLLLLPAQQPAHQHTPQCVNVF